MPTFHSLLAEFNLGPNLKKQFFPDYLQYYYNVCLLLAQITELKWKLNSVEDQLATNEKKHKNNLLETDNSTRLLEASNIELKRENEILYEEKLAAEKLIVVWKQ